jgi:hypothetical protein
MATHSRHTYAASWGDYDNDGDQDVVMSNNVYEYLDLFTNEGNGDFSLESASVLGRDTTNGGGAAWADYDNDGDLDLFVASYWPGPSLLFENGGDGSFTKILDHGLGLESGRAFGGVWADCDNDGDQDIFVWMENWDFPDQAKGRLFLNMGSGQFEPLPDDIFLCDSCASKAAVWADDDRDGDMDLLVSRVDAHMEGLDMYLNDYLYRNLGNDNHWLHIKPIGTVSNRSAVGTKVRVKATIAGQTVWQMRELVTMTGLRAQPPLEAHFGLGDATLVDSIRIEWPSGIIQVLESVSADQFMTVVERCCEDRVGDANGSGDDEPTIGDVTTLIDMLFVSDNPHLVRCIAEADVNQSGGVGPSIEDVTIGDISYLIDYLFITGAELGLPACM